MHAYAPWPTWGKLDDPGFVGHIEAYLKRPANAAHGVVWLFGDSHAARLAQGLDAATWGMKVVTIQSGKVLPTESDSHSKQAFDIFLDALGKNVQKDDIIAFLYASFRVVTWPNAEYYGGQLRRFQSLAVSKGAKLVLFDDVPNFDYPGPLCYPSKWGVKLFNCTASKMALRRKRILHTDVLRNVSALPSVYFMDLLDVLCSGDRCDETLPYLPRTVGFDDTNHLSDAGTYYLSPFICQFLMTKRLLHDR